MAETMFENVLHSKEHYFPIGKRIQNIVPAM